MEKILEKGDVFVQTEQTRIEGILKGKLSNEKKRTMEEKRNILHSFLYRDELWRNYHIIALLNFVIHTFVKIVSYWNWIINHFQIQYFTINFLYHKITRKSWRCQFLLQIIPISLQFVMQNCNL